MKPVILIARLDRLGDVLLSLPVLQYVRQHVPHAQIDFLVQSIYLPVIQPYLSTIQVSAIDSVRKQYTYLLSLSSEGKLAWDCLLSGTRHRIGLRSKPWSPFLFTDSVRQKRSDAVKSEAEYNLDLARVLVGKILGQAPEYTKPSIEIPSEAKVKQKAVELLGSLGLKPEEPFVLFHPGMRGSALNLSASQYLDLIYRVERTYKETVVISIGPVQRDIELLDTFRKAKPNLKVVQNVEIPLLREILRLAKTVFAPSTGPLHLAHYVGTSTVGFFPPVRTQNTTRWAPWGGSGESKVYFPPVSCPGTKNCIGQSCPEFFCMEKFNWQQALPTSVASR